MKVRFPGYVPERMKSGELRHRVRVEGNPKKRIRIPVGPDDPAFTEHYYAARAGQTVEETPLKPVVRHSLDELVRDYLIWLDAQVQAGNASLMTLKQRRSLFGKVCEMKDPEGERMGDLHHDLPPAGIHHIIDQWGEATAHPSKPARRLPRSGRAHALCNTAERHVVLAQERQAEENAPIAIEMASQSWR